MQRARVAHATHAALSLLITSCTPAGSGDDTARSAPSHTTDTTVAATSSSSAPSGPFRLAWEPATGRGEIEQQYANGDRARLCLQCRYPGYTGGVLIGSYSGSGFEITPAKPLRGFTSLNVFCAQDESIWDHARGVEYAFGWSENFGKGPDGERLEYRSGQIVDSGPSQVIVSSRNQGGCYRVDKRLSWPREARYLLVRTTITNTCPQPARFDFWTGDDPWLGKYHSSEGDVGYVNGSLIRTETKIDPARFRYGGVYDLGNTAAGEAEGRYSGAANFIMLRPEGRVPDRIYFANRFVHQDSELSPERPLDNKTMLAFNLGWVDRELATGQTFEIDLAMGLAESTGTAEPPHPPAIAPAEWRLLDGPPSAGLRFDFEHIDLRVTEKALEVTGQYTLANDGAEARSAGIFYPFPSDVYHPAPDYVELDGKRLEHVEARGARWPVKLPAEGTTSFVVHYRQPHHNRQATYIVTSARRWTHPIRRAEFVIHYPRSLQDVTINYPADKVWQSADEVEYRFVRTDFQPTEDVMIRWR